MVGGGFERPKVVKVKAGEELAIPFELRTGDRIKGSIRELSEDPFSYFLLDEKNFQRYRNRGKAYYLRYDNDISSDHFDAEIPETSRWYLILSARRKRLDREIEVTLKIFRP